MLSFEGEKHLKSWLTASDIGKAILEELIRKEKAKDEQKRAEQPRMELRKIVALGCNSRQGHNEGTNKEGEI